MLEHGKEERDSLGRVGALRVGTNHGVIVEGVWG